MDEDKALSPRAYWEAVKGLMQSAIAFLFFFFVIGGGIHCFNKVIGDDTDDQIHNMMVVTAAHQVKVMKAEFRVTSVLHSYRRAEQSELDEVALGFTEACKELQELNPDQNFSVKDVRQSIKDCINPAETLYSIKRYSNNRVLRSPQAH